MTYQTKNVSLGPARGIDVIKDATVTTNLGRAFSTIAEENIDTPKRMPPNIQRLKSSTAR